jgi:hypothetical protein
VKPEKTDSKYVLRFGEFGCAVIPILANKPRSAIINKMMGLTPHKNRVGSPRKKTNDPKAGLLEIAFRQSACIANDK